jgi:hypothetical protein
MTKAATQEQVLSEAKWTADARKQYLKDHPENFAGPDGSFPIRDASDVGDAWGLAGHAGNPDAVRAKIKSIAKRLGLTQGLPDTAKDDDGEKQEGAAAIASTTTRRPLKKIATLRVCWLEYNARSVNGRIYPKTTCDRIYESALRKLAADDLPITCFVSHEAANGNVNTELVGRAARIWQEGAKFWADLDLADTRTAWDMLALAEGGYLRSESMRVLGVELAHDRNYDLPLVVVQEGVEPELLGIDLTTRPGLMDTARIQQVLYESVTQQTATYTESFSLDSVFIEAKEEAPMSIPLYLQIIAGTLQEGMTADRQAHQRVHDHLAGVLDECVKPIHGSESSRLIGAAALSEEGRAIAKKHATRLAMAHDESARMLGMECAECYHSTIGIPLDPDQDGDVDAELVIPDDDSGESARRKGKKKIMTEAEMMAALAAKGYNVIAPKTVQEELSELRTELTALKESRAADPTTPQRQTQAPSAMTETQGYQPEQIYEEGEYLAGPLAPVHWKALANRRVPWPQGVDPAVALHELAPFMAYRMLETEANAMGRDIGSYIDAHERV